LEQACSGHHSDQAFYDALEESRLNVASPIDLVLLMNPATDSSLTES
jgi:hypothetical protein